jgi:hypothetical protein
VDPRRRPLAAALALLAVLAITLVAGACGAEDEKTEGTEGEYINVGEAVYQIQLTRLLGPGQRPDDEYLRSQPTLGANQAYLGVFLSVENEGDKDYFPPRDMKVVDTQDNQYLPIDVSASGFGLSFSEPIEPGDIAPPPDSPAATGQQGGALVLFRLSQESATQYLPLELDIPSPDGEESEVRLDI